MNNNLHQQECLETLLAQAYSLSLLTYGSAGNEGLSVLHERDKDAVLWLLSDLIHEAHALLTETDDKPTTETSSR